MQPNNAFKEQRTTLFLIGLLRLTNSILWSLLIYLYYRQVNSEFPEISCDDG